MKNKLIVSSFLICSFVFASGKTFSQSQTKKYFWSLGAGVSIPKNHLYANYHTGFEVGGKAGYVFTDFVASGISIDFDSFKRKNNVFYYVSNATANILSIRAFFMTGILNKDVKLKPYMILGAGVYLDRTSDAYTVFGSLKYTNFHSDFGLDIGGGLSYKISDKASIFIEPKICATINCISKEYFSLKTGVTFGQ